MSKPKNVTFNLPPELIERYKGYVEQKFISSVNAGVREALEEYVKKIDKEMLHNEMRNASKDPLFMNDLKECMDAFAAVDTESMKGNSEW
jgi:metal-responsive CopG/Arc/MetJ family transcriptional regulator